MYMPAQTIKLQEALKRMRLMSEYNIPFELSYITYSESLRVSKGLKQVPQALLRQGYRNDQSDKADILLAYTDLSDDSPRQCYIPLLMTFNGLTIQP